MLCCVVFSCFSCFNRLSCEFHVCVRKMCGEKMQKKNATHIDQFAQNFSIGKIDDIGHFLSTGHKEFFIV